MLLLAVVTCLPEQDELVKTRIDAGDAGSIEEGNGGNTKGVTSHIINPIEESEVLIGGKAISIKWFDFPSYVQDIAIELWGVDLIGSRYEKLLDIVQLNDIDPQSGYYEYKIEETFFLDFYKQFKTNDYRILIRDLDTNYCEQGNVFTITPVKILSPTPDSRNEIVFETEKSYNIAYTYSNGIVPPTSEIDYSRIKLMGLNDDVRPPRWEFVKYIADELPAVGDRTTPEIVNHKWTLEGLNKINENVSFEPAAYRIDIEIIDVDDNGVKNVVCGQSTGMMKIKSPLEWLFITYLNGDTHSGAEKEEEVIRAVNRMERGLYSMSEANRSKIKIIALIDRMDDHDDTKEEITYFKDKIKNNTGENCPYYGGGRYDLAFTCQKIIDDSRYNNTTLRSKAIHTRNKLRDVIYKAYSETGGSITTEYDGEYGVTTDVPFGMYIYFPDSRLWGWGVGKDFYAYNNSDGDGIINSWKEFITVWTDMNNNRFKMYNAYKNTEYYEDDEQPYVNIEWLSNMDGGIINLMYDDYFHSPILESIPMGTNAHKWYPSSNIQERNDFQIQIQKDDMIYHPFINKSFSMHKKPLVLVQWQDYTSSRNEQNIPNTNNSIIDNATVHISDISEFHVTPPDGDDPILPEFEVIDTPFPHIIDYDEDRGWYFEIIATVSNWFGEGPFELKLARGRVQDNWYTTNLPITVDQEGYIGIHVFFDDLEPGTTYSTEIPLVASCLGNTGNNRVKFIKGFSYNNGNSEPTIFDYTFNIPFSITVE